MALTDKLRAIGNAIRNKTGNTAPLTLEQMPQEIERITTGDYTEGYVQKLHDILATGSWFDLFWETYQDGGKRRRYRSAFNCDQADARQFWTLATLRPKYSFGNVTGAAHMFYHLQIQKDFMKYFGQYVENFTFSLKESEDNTYAFCFSQFTHLPELDLTGAGALNDLVLGYARFLQEVHIKVDNTVKPLSYSNLLQGQKHAGYLIKGCNALREVYIDGELCANLDFEESTNLSKECVIRVMEARSQYSAENTIIFKKTMIDKLFNTSGSPPYTGSESDEWKDLINARPNWTVVLKN